MVKEILKSVLIPRADYLFGFANLNGLIDKKYADLVYGISIIKKLDDKIIDPIVGGPTLEYYNYYNKVNQELYGVSLQIAEKLEQKDIKTKVIKPTIATEELDSVYKETLRTDLSHKMVATRAGLGWIGKTDLLVTRIFGPRIRLTTILTNKAMESQSKPFDVSECGSCHICVNACPARAANGKLWDIMIDRDKFFDAFKCREMCQEFGRTRLNRDVRICGICVAVCPIGKKKSAGVSSGLAN
jgi:epoxyqueuosine reductase